FFFFQAEDGIRDGHVTGVQTCALPISALSRSVKWPVHSRTMSTPKSRHGILVGSVCASTAIDLPLMTRFFSSELTSPGKRPCTEIGRASCRERVEIGVVAGLLQKRVVW